MLREEKSEEVTEFDYTLRIVFTRRIVVVISKASSKQLQYLSTE